MREGPHYWNETLTVKSKWKTGLSAIEDEYEHEETLKATEDDVNVTIGEKDMDISTVEEDNLVDVPQKPESLQERNERLTIEMKNAFGVLAGLGTKNTMYGEHFKRDRVIVDIPYILELFNGGCHHSSCSGTSQVKHHIKEGGVLKIWWSCSEGHYGIWVSSKELCEKRGRHVYTNSLLIAAGIFLTGNNYDKLALFCRFLGLELISKATYNRMQTHYIIPEVQRYWEQMKNEIWDILSGESVILCGDGSAEVVTDASSAVIALVRTMKGNLRCLFIHLRCLLMLICQLKISPDDVLSLL